MIDQALEERERFHARAAKVIDSVLRRYVADGSLDADEADDVRSVVTLGLVRRFGQAAASDVRSIEDFVATITHNAARDVFRGRRPDRTRLRKRVQAILAGDERFVCTRDSATWCALRDFAAAPRVEPPALTDHDFAVARELPLDDRIAHLLRRAGGVVQLERLIDLVAEIEGIPLAGGTTEIDERALVDTKPGAETRLIARETLAALWDEVCRLPLPQRTALLLHLRDHHGRGAVPLLVFTGLATLDEIGAALQLDRTRMEQLWDDLPLPDNDIAAMLSTTRERIIGLRRAARARLARRLRRLGGGW
jgi:DNA-directed RNA polymerase specialized sigma24 family protein